MRALLLLLLLLPGLPSVAAAPEGAVERGQGEIRRIDPDPVQVTPRMESYSNIRYALYFGREAAAAAALLLLLYLGVARRCRDWVEARLPPFWAPGVVFLLLYFAYRLLLLPLSFYAGFLLPHQYGLATVSPGGWAADWLRGGAVAAGMILPVVLLAYHLMRSCPQRWWLRTWFFLAPMLLAGVWLTPLVIDPLFNRFSPLPEGRLSEEIRSLTGRAGIGRSRIFVVDASRRTRALNAYVTGLGGTARVVFWDNLLNRCTPEEVLATAAHEVAHYAEGHVPLLALGGAAGSLPLLWLLDLAYRRLLARRAREWGIRSPADPAGIPALALVLSLLLFFGAPLESAVSRYFEKRADLYALRLTGDGPAAARSFKRLAEENLAHPDPPPFVRFWLFTHPPLNERIRTALLWGRRPPATVDGAEGTAPPAQ